MITQERLKELLDYNIETGIFTRNITVGSRAMKGMIVGSPDKDGYLEVTLNRRKYKLHRLAFLYIEGKFPIEVEHDNRIKFDNRWCNLIATTRLENQKNLPKQKNNTSGVTGVIWYKLTNRWRASIAVNNKTIYLGYYKDKNDAILAREAANIKYGFHVNHGKLITI